MQNRRVLGLNPTGGYDLNGSAGQIVCWIKIQVGKLKKQPDWGDTIWRGVLAKSYVRSNQKIAELKAIQLREGVQFEGKCLPNRMC